MFSEEGKGLYLFFKHESKRPVTYSTALAGKGRSEKAQVNPCSQRLGGDFCNVMQTVRLLRRLIRPQKENVPASESAWGIGLIIGKTQLPVRLCMPASGGYLF
jgi:hypothetical protein